MGDFHQLLLVNATTLREAMERIDSLGGRGITLYVVDAEGRPEGSLTDGDIRRALLRGVSITAGVGEAMCASFLAIRPGCDRLQLTAEARRRGVTSLPVIDAGGCLVDVIDPSRDSTPLPIDAVLMAGGKGERLRPLTLTTPKPLLKVGEKAIIDYNVDALALCGVKNMFVTVNYMHELLEAHFKDERAGVKVECVLEPAPLGTIGSLALIDGLTHDDVLLMNSDLLTTIDFRALYRRHCETGAAMTMATVPYAVSVPYAIIRSEGDTVLGLEEKPTFNYFANAGVYILKRSLISRIPRGERVDATDFMEALIADGLKVSWYPIKGTWIDIGSPEDYRAACALMER